ncbi:MAG: hypothetical protein J5F18_15240 [Halomonas sp. BM-2019]|nr:MAG: hypothetical protein J5F18_15240 [Halomonas sp. BM-2019]
MNRPEAPDDAGAILTCTLYRLSVFIQNPEGGNLAEIWLRKALPDD